MSKEYIVSLEVTEEQISTMLKIVAPYAKLSGDIKEKVNSEEPKGFRFAGGRRDKGISAYNLLMEQVNRIGGVVGYDKLRYEFGLRGFAPTSISATITQLVREGKLIRVGKGAVMLNPVQEQS